MMIIVGVLIEQKSPEQRNSYQTSNYFPNIFKLWMLLHHMPYLICLSFYIGVIELELFSSLDDEINPIEQKKQYIWITTHTQKWNFKKYLNLIKT